MLRYIGPFANFILQTGSGPSVQVTRFSPALLHDPFVGEGLKFVRFDAERTEDFRIVLA